MPSTSATADALQSALNNVTDEKILDLNEFPALATAVKTVVPKREPQVQEEAKVVKPEGEKALAPNARARRKATRQDQRGQAQGLTARVEGVPTIGFADNVRMVPTRSQRKRGVSQASLDRALELLLGAKKVDPTVYQTTIRYRGKHVLVNPRRTGKTKLANPEARNRKEDRRISRYKAALSLEEAGSRPQSGQATGTSGGRGVIHPGRTIVSSKPAQKELSQLLDQHDGKPTRCPKCNCRAICYYPGKDGYKGSVYCYRCYEDSVWGACPGVKMPAATFSSAAIPNMKVVEASPTANVDGLWKVVDGSDWDQVSVSPSTTSTASIRTLTRRRLRKAVSAKKRLGGSTSSASSTTNAVVGSVTPSEPASSGSGSETPNPKPEKGQKKGRGAPNHDPRDHPLSGVGGPHRDKAAEKQPVGSKGTVGLPTIQEEYAEKALRDDLERVYQLKKVSAGGINTLLPGQTDLAIGGLPGHGLEGYLATRDAVLGSDPAVHTSKPLGWLDKKASGQGVRVVDPQLVAYLALQAACRPRTALRIEELKKRAMTFVEKHRAHWTHEDRLYGILLAVNASLDVTPLEQALMTRLGSSKMNGLINDNAKALSGDLGRRVDLSRMLTLKSPIVKTTLPK